MFTIDYMLIALVIIITTDLYHYSYRYCFVHHACFQVYGAFMPSIPIYQIPTVCKLKDVGFPSGDLPASWRNTNKSKIRFPTQSTVLLAKVFTERKRVQKAGI